MHVILSFYNTCVRQSDPELDVEFSAQCLKFLAERGSTFSLLFTEKSPSTYRRLELAKEWFSKNGLAIMEPKHIPTDTEKIIISPQTIGCPLNYDRLSDGSIEYFVDWYQIARLVSGESITSL